MVCHVGDVLESRLDALQPLVAPGFARRAGEGCLGQGLGMAIVQRDIQSLCGQVEIASLWNC
jgi:hypothetical protein